MSLSWALISRSSHHARLDNLFPYLGEQVLREVHLDQVCETVEGRPVDLLEAAFGRRQTLEVDEAEPGELARGEQGNGVPGQVQRLCARVDVGRDPREAFV